MKSLVHSTVVLVAVLAMAAVAGAGLPVPPAPPGLPSPSRLPGLPLPPALPGVTITVPGGAPVKKIKKKKPGNRGKHYGQSRTGKGKR